MLQGTPWGNAHGKLAEEVPAEIPEVDTSEVEKLNVYMCMKQRERYELKERQRGGNRESKKKKKEMTLGII